jgi:8-oxo-dGTP pyrophosphatase MutT (NUDIX family)
MPEYRIAMQRFMGTMARPLDFAGNRNRDCRMTNAECRMQNAKSGMKAAVSGAFDLHSAIGILQSNMALAERKGMAREFSAGGIVLRRMRGAWWVAAIHPRRTNDDKVTRSAKRRGRIFALPKGTIDPGEKAPQTAAREIREETGVDANLVAKLGDIKYVYVRSWGDRSRVFKIVSFFLFLYRSGRLGNIPANMRHEVESAEWVPLDEAARRLSYQGEREMAAAAEKYVQEHPDIGEETSAPPRRGDAEKH